VSQKRTGPPAVPTFEPLESRLLLDASAPTDAELLAVGPPAACANPAPALLSTFLPDAVTGDSYMALGADGYAELAAAGATDLDYARDFSVEAIFNIDAFELAGRWSAVAAKGGFNVGYYAGTPGWYLGLYAGDDTLAGKKIWARVCDGNEHAVTVGGERVTGRVHAVMTWDASARALELVVNDGIGDGIGDDVGLAAAGTNAELLPEDIANSGPLRIGKSYTTFQNDIFLVRLWNRRLARGEITALWQQWTEQGSDRLPAEFDTTDLHSEWLMDEQCAADGSAGAGYLKDTGPAGNHLQLRGGADVIQGTGPLTLAGPAEGAADVEKSAFLEAAGGWDALDGTDVGPLQYAFQVDTVATFDSPDLLESGWISHYGRWRPGLAANTTYHWRARVRDGDGTVSDWTAAGAFTTEPAETWYVRPRGGSYGAEDGTSYEDAWDGLAEVVWGTEGVEHGDTLYLCGAFLRDDGSDDDQGIEIQASGVCDDIPVTIRMDDPHDPGVYWGVSPLDVAWTPAGGGVYTTTHSVETDYGVFQDVAGLEHTLLLKADGPMPEPGQWAYDETAGVFSIHLSDGGDPAGRVWARTADSYTTWTVRRTEYVRFQNCRFWGAPFNPGSSDYDLYGPDVPARASHITFDGTSIRYSRRPLIGYLYDDHDHWTFDGCDLQHGGSGVYVNSGAREHQGAAHLTVRNCTIKHIATGTFPNGSADGHAIGIQGGHDYLIEKNTFEDVGTGVTFYGYSWQTIHDNVVRWNFFTDVNRVGGGHGRGIETGGASGASDCSGNLWYGNILHNVTGLPGSEGIGFRPTIPSLNGNDNTILVFNNLVYDAQHCYYGYTGSPGPDSEFYNNVFLAPTDNFVYYVWANACQGADYNLYYPDADQGQPFDVHWDMHWTRGDFYDWQSTTGFDAHGLISDPRLTNPAGAGEAADFYPLWDSPVIDAGDDAPGHYQPTDYAGNPLYGTPDIGPWEYQPPYAMGVDPLAVGQGIRIYADGMYRWLTAGGAQQAALAVAPAAGWDSFGAQQQRPFWMDLELTDWTIDGATYCRWTEADAAVGAGEAVAYTLDGFEAGATYLLRVNGALNANLSGAAVSDSVVRADAAGRVSFTYTGSHQGTTFELSDILAGDADRDGDVDDTDLASLMGNFGQAASWTGGDFDFDADADDVDLSLLLGNYGQPGQGKPAAAPDAATDAGPAAPLGYEGANAGDHVLHLGAAGYAARSDADVTDLDYSKSFSVEGVLYIERYDTTERWGGIVTKGPTYVLWRADQPGWGLGISNGHLESFGEVIQAKVGDGAKQVSVSSPSCTGTTYAVLTWDAPARTLRLYINGEEVASGTNADIDLAGIETSSDLQIGRAYHVLQRDVLLGRLWNRLLSPGEVGQLWDAFEIADGDGTGAHELPAGFNTADLHSAWHMDQTCGPDGQAGTDHLRDAVGANHLRLYGGAELWLGGGPLELTGPADGATGVEKSVTLTAAGGAAELADPARPLRYRFQIDTAATFDSPELRTSEWSVHYAAWKPVLAPDTTYYWRGQVADAAGNASAWTAARAFTTEPAETWYVRPAGGSYGSEDGTSYANAWDGLRAVEWGPGGVEAGDTLYVCGVHVHTITEWNFVAAQATEPIRESGRADAPITIRMDAAEETGVIWGCWEDGRSEIGGSLSWYGPDANGVYWTDELPTDTSILYQDAHLGADGVALLERDTAAPTWTDGLGTFCVYDGKVYLKTTDGGDPTGRVYRSGLGYRFSLDRASHVTFLHCNFYGLSMSAQKADAAITDVPVSQYLTWDGVTMRYCTGNAISIYDFQDHWTVRNSTFLDAGNGVYSISNTNNAADSLAVQNCTFRRMGISPFYHQDAHAVGIQGGDGHRIEGNVSYDTGSAYCLHAWTFQEMKDAILRGNFAGEVRHGTAFSISGAHGSPYGMRTGIELYNNIAAGTESAGFGTNGVDPVVLHDNVTYDGDWAFTTWTRDFGPHWVGQNNVVLDPRELYLFFSNGHGTSDWSLDWDYNLYWPSASLDGDGRDFYVRDNGYMSLSYWMDNTGWDEHGAVADPRFENASGTYSQPEDFYPLWDSPVIDAGEFVGIEFAYADQPVYGTPDIGAWEYQPPYEMGVDPLAVGQQVRIYADGMYRWLTAGGAQQAALAVAPPAGWDTFGPQQQRPFWMDLELTDWTIDGATYCRWTESDAALGAGDGVAYTLDGFDAGATYLLRVNGALDANLTGAAVSDSVVRADAAGRIRFTYTGSHQGTTFELSDILAGDADRDGDVDDADLDALLANFGQAASWTGGDFDFDAEADDADLSLLLSNYGAVAATQMTSGPVEPVELTRATAEAKPPVGRLRAAAVVPTAHAPAAVRAPDLLTTLPALNLDPLAV